jgi:RNA polymerase sigma factor (sigma-70 family)
MDHAGPFSTQSLPTVDPFTFADVPRLAAALQRGDEAAYSWLHGQWHRRISRYAFAIAAGDESFAAEIAQATWLRIVRHLRAVRDEAVLWSWVACAARHAASDLRRKGGRYRRALSCFAEWCSRRQASVDEAEADHLLAALEAALLKLSHAERELVDGRYFGGESLDRMGARHSVTARAIEGRLARVRQRLRDLIAEQLQSQKS